MDTSLDFSQLDVAELLDVLKEGIYIVNPQRIIVYWNKEAERISGFSKEEVIGHPCAANILTHIDKDGNALCHGMCPLAHTIDDAQPRESEIYLHHKKGHRVPVNVKVHQLRDMSGKVIGGLESFVAITNNMENENRVKELSRLALLDPLTQLGNRAALDQELEKSMLEFKELQLSFAVLFFDIDHFKAFNDEYGHDVGDKILKSVASTLLVNSRPFDFYGRWGGEEFMAIIPNVSIQHLKNMAERLRILIENSYVLHQNSRLNVTVSIGGTIIKQEDDTNSLFQRTDQLLYLSKHSGRNTCSVA